MFFLFANSRASSIDIKYKVPLIFIQKVEIYVLSQRFRAINDNFFELRIINRSWRGHVYPRI
jgi:hypothetical protein